MRNLRIEIAIAALLLAPFAGYAIGYFFAKDTIQETSAKPAATMPDTLRTNSLSTDLRATDLAIAGLVSSADVAGPAGRHVT